MREKDLEKLEYRKIKEVLKHISRSPATEKFIDRLRPLKESNLLWEEIELTKTFFNIADSIEIYNFPDIEIIIEKSKISSAVLTVDEITDIYHVLKLIKEVKKNIGTYVEEVPLLKRLLKNIFSFQHIESLIESSIDPRGFVKDEASEDLYNVRKDLRKIEEEIKTRLERLFERPDASVIFSDKIITIRNNRYVIPVKTTYHRKIYGIVHGTSSSGYTTYLEPQFVVELNNRISVLKEREDKEVRKILMRITQYIGENNDRLMNSFNALVYIDFMRAKYEFSKMIDGNFASIGKQVSLKEARHPILILENRNPVSINIEMVSKRGLILTGPNTGGKTVSLKTLGLLALMFQSALPIPANPESELPVFENIFVDIGDEQNIQQNLSTFSSHISNIVDFIDKVNEKTLVLIDELGSGTDPAEGSAIGIGILEYLKELNPFVFVNTHHTPIKLYAISSDYYIPASVSFDRETLKPTYSIIYNTIGQSMALHIAGKLGIPQEILDTARRKLGSSGEEYFKAIEKLDEYTKEYQEKLREMELIRSSLERERDRYKRLSEELEEKKKEGWVKIASEAYNFLDTLKKEGRKILSSNNVKELEKFVESKKREIAMKIGDEKMLRFSVGDWVELVTNPGKKGRIEKVEGNIAVVSFGHIRLRAKFKELIPVESVSREAIRDETINIRKSLPSELYLKGLSIDEALFKLETFLEEAHSSGVKMAKIIHGVGTGAIKRAVREYLSKSPYVVFFRDAYPQEGGSGITVVFFDRN